MVEYGPGGVPRVPTSVAQRGRSQNAVRNENAYHRRVAQKSVDRGQGRTPTRPLHGRGGPAGANAKRPHELSVIRNGLRRIRIQVGAMLALVSRLSIEADAPPSPKHGRPWNERVRYLDDGWGPSLTVFYCRYLVEGGEGCETCFSRPLAVRSK